MPAGVAPGSWARRAGGRNGALSAAWFVAEAVLTEEQQRRQGIYGEFLKKPRAERNEGHPVLLAWAKPIDTGFHLVPDSRTVGTALLVVPVRFSRPETGARVT